MTGWDGCPSLLLFNATVLPSFSAAAIIFLPAVVVLFIFGRSLFFLEASAVRFLYQMSLLAACALISDAFRVVWNSGRASILFISSLHTEFFVILLSTVEMQQYFFAIIEFNFASRQCLVFFFFYLFLFFV